MKGLVVDPCFGQPAGRHVFKLVQQPGNACILVNLGDADVDPDLVGAVQFPLRALVRVLVSRRADVRTRIRWIDRPKNILDGPVEHPVGRSGKLEQPSVALHDVAVEGHNGRSQGRGLERRLKTGVGSGCFPLGSAQGRHVRHRGHMPDQNSR